MRARWTVVSTAVLVTGMLVVPVAAEAQPATTGKTSAPAKKSAPKKPAAPATSHCQGPWIDRGSKEICPSSAEPNAGNNNKVNTLEDIYAPPAKS